jgi:Domain of unknown function (DUF4157)
MSDKSTTTTKPEVKSPEISADRSPLLQHQSELGHTQGLIGDRTSLSQPAPEQSGLSAPASFAPVLHEFIQPKLTVGTPNDKYEQEADRVANEVMRMPSVKEESNSTSPMTTEFPSMQLLQIDKVTSIQRKNSQLEKEDDGEIKEEEIVQAKSNSDRSITPSSLIETQLSSSKKRGASLPLSTRAFMESRFGHDFSSVQVYSDANAISMNHQLNSRAFTHGDSIYFGRGQYNPNTQTGQYLLAHELTHVMQQTGTIKRKMNLSQAENISEPVETESESSNLGDSQNFLDVEIIIKQIINALGSEPDSRSGRVKLLLSRLNLSTRHTVLSQLQTRLSSEQQQTLQTILSELTPDRSQSQTNWETSQQGSLTKDRPLTNANTSQSIERDIVNQMTNRENLERVHLTQLENVKDIPAPVKRDLVIMKQVL